MSLFMARMFNTASATIVFIKISYNFKVSLHHWNK